MLSKQLLFCYIDLKNEIICLFCKYGKYSADFSIPIKFVNISSANPVFRKQEDKFTYITSKCCKINKIFVLQKILLFIRSLIFVITNFYELKTELR